MVRSTLGTESLDRHWMLELADEMAAEKEADMRFRVDPSKAGPKRVFVNCHYCGYSPEKGIPSNGICPKCLGSSWERFALSARLVPPHMH